MKKINKLSILALCLVLLASIAYGAIIPDSARLQITLISQEPDPANPGEIVNVRFKVENIGGKGTEDIILEVLPESPFSLYKGEAVRNIGSMQAYQNGEEGIIVHYELKVDEDAIEGDNFLDIRYKFGEISSKWIYIKDFPIRVRTRDLILSIEEIESDPESISPGKDFQLSFTLRNNADSLVKDVTVKLGLTDDSIPFAPSKSTAEKQIYQIKSKTGSIMRFDLIALPDAEGGIYKVPINLSYTDETGTSYTKEDVISLKISSTPDLLVTVESSGIDAKEKSGEIVLKIVNRGLTNLKLLTAELESSKEVIVNSEPEVYVGNIDSDDYETVEYTITVKSYESIVNLPLKLTYMDVTNKKHQQEIPIELKTGSKGLVLSIISGIVSALIRLAILAGIIFGLYKAYKWWMKKRKKRS